MAFFKKIVFLIFVIFAAVFVFLLWVIKDQGVGANSWAQYDRAQVVFDADGIPTITADNWEHLIQAQGYVVAAERLWQMDLMRRVAAGRLSEWFGSKAREADIRKIEEDWAGVAARAVSAMTTDDKVFCDTYAAGVNGFISANRHKWGLEYTLLQVSPEPWTCQDSILVLMNMSEYLTGTANDDLREWPWRRGMTDEWHWFLFPKYHPWARPIFGSPARQAIKMPPVWQYIPRQPLVFEAQKRAEQNGHVGDADIEPLMPGSNAWAIATPDRTLLAGDPHLRHGVPDVWFANRLRVNSKEWVVGVSLPGIPGVTIGMNPALAWTFTNLGDDVDDYLIEEVNRDVTEYLAFRENEKPFWQRIVKKSRTLRIKGDADETIETMATHRGPLRKMKEFDGQYVSRQWLAFRDGALGLPTVAVAQARTWREFNAALDRMVSPSQCVLYADRLGNIGYRATGLDVKRRGPGQWPRPALEGEWLSVGKPAARKRVILGIPAASEEGQRRFLANANAQIWEDTYGHRWDTEDRHARIDEMLSQVPADQIDVKSMHKMQLDTRSRYFKLFTDWIMQRASAVSDGIAGKADLFNRWRAWDGFAASDAMAFTYAVAADALLVRTAVQRVRGHFFAAAGDSLEEYKFRNRRAWILTMLEAPEGCLVFGLSCTELADYIVSAIVSAQRNPQVEKALNIFVSVPYYDINPWAVQHPFVGRIPVIGWLFHIAAPPQKGFSQIVRAEFHEFGASVRMVWDLRNPLESTWSFPVGQSGHIGSPHYRDWQKLWFKDEVRPIFNPQDTWEFIN